MGIDRSLPLDDYRTAIELDAPIRIRRNSNWAAQLNAVLKKLELRVPHAASIQEKLHALHGELAIIGAHELPGALIEDIETIAVEWNSQVQHIKAATLPSIAEQYRGAYSAGHDTSIWVGDITHLGVDAIVNAANTELLGCRIPNHACIDNAIHSAAGPQLRDDCATIIERQRTAEPVGTAKITRGYALSAKFVVHTVGPQLRPGSQPTGEHNLQLERAYQSCLDLAACVDQIRTIAFCAISTGIFAYPKQQAASVALKVVAGWLNTHPGRFERVVFNLFSDADAAVYENLLDAW